MTYQWFLILLVSFLVRGLNCLGSTLPGMSLHNSIQRAPLIPAVIALHVTSITVMITLRGGNQGSDALVSPRYSVYYLDTNISTFCRVIMTRSWQTQKAISYVQPAEKTIDFVSYSRSNRKHFKPFNNSWLWCKDVFLTVCSSPAVVLSMLSGAALYIYQRGHTLEWKSMVRL